MNKILLLVAVTIGMSIHLNAQVAIDNNSWGSAPKEDSAAPPLTVQFFKEKHNGTLYATNGREYTGQISLSSFFSKGQGVSVISKGINTQVDSLHYFSADTGYYVVGKDNKRVYDKTYFAFEINENNKKVLFKGYLNYAGLLKQKGRIKSQISYQAVQEIIDGPITLYYVYFMDQQKLYVDRFVLKQETLEIFMNEAFSLAPNFYKKMSKFVSDYPELAEKIKAKDPAYSTYTSIINEYNRWYKLKHP